MKFTIILLLIINVLFGEDFFPDKAKTNPEETFVIDPQNDPNSKKLLIEQDILLSKDKELDTLEITNNIDTLGKKSIVEEVDASNVSHLKGYADRLKKSAASDTTTMGNNFKAKSGQNFDARDTSTLTNDRILEDYPESSSAEAVRTMKRLSTVILSKIGNIKTIDCYVTRKLAHSYYCPLPSMDNSFFKGGNFKDDNVEAKKECEGLCQEQSSCVSKDMNKSQYVIENYIDFLVKDGQSIEIIGDTEMLGDYLELNFTSTYQYDAAIPLDDVNFDPIKSIEELKKKKVIFRVNASYFNEFTNSFEKFIENKRVKTDEADLTIKIYLEHLNSSKYKIDFFPIYESEAGVETLLPEAKVTLDKSTLAYVDNKYWFCAASQFMDEAAECTGELKNIEIGATSYKVCLTKESKVREAVYGAYYTESQCQMSCKLKAECVPTYRHLTSFDPNNLPSGLKDIEIDCVDTPTNTSCTKELCKELFIEDKMPISESTWLSNDTTKTTVSNSVQEKGLVRPRVDIVGGLSANGDAEQRDKTSLREMTEISYSNMIETNTFNVSEQAIKEEINKKMGYNSFKSEKGNSLSLLLKPHSFQIDDEKTYNIYSVLEIDRLYRPVYTEYIASNGTVTGMSDINIEVVDRVYLLQTPSGYKILKVIEHRIGKVRVKTCVTKIVDLEEVKTCTNKYTWGDMPTHLIEYDKTFVAGQYVNYDVSSEAEVYTTRKFSSDKKWEEFAVYDNTEGIAELPGVLFKTQTAQSIGNKSDKVFTGPYDPLKRASLKNIKAYGLYSEKKLTYREILDQLNESNAYYSTLEKYPKTIKPDGKTANNVDMYITGAPNKMSVNIDFRPTPNEEGKKAFIFMLLYNGE